MCPVTGTQQDVWGPRAVTEEREAHGDVGETGGQGQTALDLVWSWERS